MDKKAKWRKKYPLKAAYQTLRYNARRRGKPFDLTFKQFEQFAVRTDYVKKKGVYKDSYHIDRVDESKGYTIDNIQVLTNSENVRKFIDYKGRDFDNTPILRVQVDMPGKNKAGDCPF